MDVFPGLLVLTGALLYLAGQWQPRIRGKGLGITFIVLGFLIYAFLLLAFISRG